MALQKKCSKCKRTKALGDFGLNKNKSGDVNPRCKACCLQYDKDRRSTEEGRIALRRTRLKTKYGITYEQFQAMVMAQGGRCANDGCGNPGVCVDHCHETRAVRAILCNACNLALGNLGESVERIHGLAAYIRAHGGK